MALLPTDEQSAPADEGMEAYAPSVKGSGAKKAAAAKPGAASRPGVPAGARPAAEGNAFSGLRVSLMPSELEGKAPPDLGRGLMILGLVIIVETIAIGAGYFFVSKAIDGRIGRRGQLETQLDQLNKDVVKQEAAAKEAAAYNGQVLAAQEALDNHVFWTKFYAFLEARTRPTIKYLNFSGDADSGIVTLDAVGRTFRDVAEQIVAFKEDPMIVDVRTASASAKVNEKGEVTGVAFTMVLKLKRDTWLAPKQAVQAN